MDEKGTRQDHLGGVIKGTVPVDVQSHRQLAQTADASDTDGTGLTHRNVYNHVGYAPT